MDMVVYKALNAGVKILKGAYMMFVLGVITLSIVSTVLSTVDLAPYVGADLSVMERDSKKMRDDKPFMFTNIRGMEGVNEVANWIKTNVLLEGLNHE